MPGCLPLSGTGTSTTGGGSLSVASMNLDFGDGVVGGNTELSDSLTNHSSAIVTISSFASTDSAFQVVSPATPLALQPGQSASLTIAFSPRSVGQPTGKVTIRSDASSAAQIDLSVKGKAVAAGKLTVTPSSLVFGSVPVGQSQAKSVTLTNAGGSSVTASQNSVSSAAFTVSGLSLPVTLAPGQSAIFTATFSPKAPSPVSGSITVNGSASLATNLANASGPKKTSATSVALSVSGDGTAAGQLAAVPASVSFGSVTLGSSQKQTVTLTNSGGSSATISQSSLTGSGLTISGLALPLTLAAGQSAGFDLTFAPMAAGTLSGSLSIVSTATNSNLAMAVTGTAVSAGALTFNPSAIGFGSVTVGSTQNQTGTVTNSGGSAVTITRVTAAGAGFSTSGMSVPVTLSPGQSANFTATFAPQSAGSATGSIAFTSNIATASVALAGTGQALGTLGASPATFNAGSVQVGSNQSQTITLTNGGSSSLTINQASATGSGFSVTGISVPLVLNAGQSTSFTATFAPSAAGAVTGNIAITSTASNPSLNIALTGTGVTAGTLAANPTSIAFSSVQVGNSQSQTQRLTNSGGSPIHIATANVTGAGFATGGLSVPSTLNAGQTLTFSVIFTPTSAGAATGSLALTADGSVPSLSVALSGTGTAPGQLAASPATSNFGSVTVGTSQTQAGSLVASGASVTVSAVGSSNAEFVVSGLSLPLTLTAGQTVPFTLKFTPQASGAASSTITFTSNATNSPVTQAASGNGTAPPQHSVSLAWTASTSTVAGYNVYRGTQSGGPYAIINGSTETSTTYTDNSVQGGQTYYYVVTALDGSGNESVNSNQAQAVVPSP
jgi:HYDIN/CFA65/VesB family protein/centrosomal CEP192-like protein/ASPM-SPD-2-Hydin domain-containing protein